MESSEEYLARLQGYIGSWVVEKARRVLEDVVELYEGFRKRDDLPEEFVETLQAHLHPIIFNCTKVLSFATDKEWDVGDAAAIWEKGATGLDRVLVKYGLLSEDQTEEAKKRYRIRSLVRDLEELSESLRSGTRYPARTLAHVLLLRLPKQDPLVAEMSGLTEQVTMGELAWDDYVNPATELVKGLLANYREIERQDYE